MTNQTNQSNQHQPPTGQKTPSRRGLTRDAVVAATCGFVAVLMVGAAYAAVPFYNWFCRATGFNGTTQVATSAPAGAPLERDAGAAIVKAARRRARIPRRAPRV